MSKCLSPDNCNYSDKGWCPRCEPASSPTPPDAPTPEQLTALRELVKGPYSERLLLFDQRDSLASLLRAYEGMRADAERWRWIRPLLTLAPWSKSHVYLRLENRNTLQTERWPHTVEDFVDPVALSKESRAARASAPDSEVENA